MNPSFDYVARAEKRLYQNPETPDTKNQSLKNVKVAHFLKVLDKCGIQPSVVIQVSDFFRHLIRRNRRLGTITSYYHGTKRFLLFMKHLGINRIEFVNRDHLGAYIEFLQDQGLKPSSINTHLRGLYMFLGFLIEKDLINPEIMARKYRLRMPDELPKAIDPEDIKQLLSVLDTPRERALILVLLRTGMRIGELLETKVVDINLSEKKICIYQAEKNYEGRVVYLSDDACSALKVWLRKRNTTREYIFYGSGERKRLSYAQARKLFVKYIQKASLESKGYTLHCLRHTFASELLNAGMRLECLQILLGHQNIEMTRRYARLTDITRRHEYYKAMDIIERGEIDGYYRFDN